MRVCVAGGGLAGSLLAWRLAQLPDVGIDLVLGRDRATDATDASGGAVRAYEPLPAQRELAIASMAELLGSPVLQRWADYRQAAFAYLRDTEEDLSAELAEINRELPGSAELMPAAEAFGSTASGRGWAGPAASTVLERRAGYLSPGRLRDAVIADLAGRPRARVLAAELDTVMITSGGPVRSRAGGIAGEHDVLVLAVGAWTPEVLRASGFPAQAYRTKSIQFTSYDTGRWRPPMFADERTGLYSKPMADGGLLLGVPTAEWDVPPGRAAVTPAVHRRAIQLAADYLPQLRLGRVRAQMNAADCFCDPPLLSLRTVVDSSTSLLTFTGGSGGSVKTALAASQRAALQIQAGMITVPTSR